MMDWRIGRLVRSDPVLFTTGQGSITIPQNRQRVAILFGLAGVSDAATPAAISVNVIGEGVMSFQSPVGPFLMSLLTHGDLVMKELKFVDQNGNFDTWVKTWTMPEDYLAAGLEQFESEYARGHS